MLPPLRILLIYTHTHTHARTRARAYVHIYDQKNNNFYFKLCYLSLCVYFANDINECCAQYALSLISENGFRRASITTYFFVKILHN